MSGYIGLSTADESMVRQSEVGRWTSVFSYSWWQCDEFSLESVKDAGCRYTIAFDSYEIAQALDFNPGWDIISYVSRAASECGRVALLVLLRSIDDPTTHYDRWRSHIESRPSTLQTASGRLDHALCYSVVPVTGEVTAALEHPVTHLSDIPGFVAVMRIGRAAADEETVARILFGTCDDLLAVIGWGEDGDCLVGLANATEEQMGSFATSVFGKLDRDMQSRHLGSEKTQPDGVP